MKNSSGFAAHTLHKLSVPILTAIIAALGLTLCCAIALAQSGAGSIQGTVTDSTGAVLPGATVHVVNQATNVATDTKSNAFGFYQVPDLFAGTYTVTVTAQRMKTYETTIQVLVAQAAVINPAMTTGAVTQQVTVLGNTVQLTTTDNGAITATLDNARINQLPMNGRNLLTLTGETTPGLEDGGQEVNGLLPETLAYIVDGADTEQLLNGGEYTGGASQVIDPDSVQEVSLQLNSSGAQYATPATAIVTTKSGTNSLHGTFFETARNNGLGLAKDRQDPAIYSAPHLVRNEFGASAGGPIIIPHLYHGKDKSFWFFSYERYSQASNVAAETKVPTAAMSQGDFSGLINSSGVLQTLYDPSTTQNSATCAATGAANAYCRTPFLNNQIPIGEISPVAKIYYEMSPPPTSSANPLVGDNLNVVEPTFEVRPQWTVRLDHVFNENNRAYVRYTQVINATNESESGALNLAADGIPVGAAEGYSNSPSWSHIASIGYTHIFSSDFFSQTILSQQWFNVSLVGGVDSGVDFESKLGLPNNFGEVGFPDLGDGDLIYNLSGSQDGDESDQIITMLDEDLTKILGRHQFQFGGRYRHERVMDLPEVTPDVIGFSALSTGIYNTASSGNYDALPNTGYADASFFLGSPSVYTTYLDAPHSHYHVMEFDTYFQDNYHVSRNLTVNLGLRYEAHPAIWYKYGLFSGFDFKNDAAVLSVPPATLIAEGYTTQAIITNLQNIGVNFETPTEAGMPSKLLRNYDLDFLPRLGIAYQPFGSRSGTVIRGGYGRYDFPVNFSAWSNQTMRPPWLDANYSQSYTTANQAIDGLSNELIRYNDPVVFGVMGENQANAVNTNTTNSILPGVTETSIDPNWAPELATETNVTVEQALKGNSALGVSWVWTHGTNLNVVDEYNNQPTNYVWELATGTLPPAGGASVIETPEQDTYSATATGPYNQTTWGESTSREATGWSNDNALEINYQRLFHHGSGYQIMYVYSKPLRIYGDAHTDIYPDANYPGILGTEGVMSSPYGTIGPVAAPPARPANLPDWADWHAMDDYQAYQLDSTTPKLHIQFNGIIDLPFGRGERFLGNANRFVNELVGGFQLAGDGQVVSQVFQGITSDWGPVAPLKVYKHRFPLTDCRTGVCYKAYMWFNGYLAPTTTTGVSGSTCTKNCVTGLPADYQPAVQPIDNTPGTTYYGDNEVAVKLLNGTTVPLGFTGGPQGANYWGKTWINGPNNWNADLSIFKVFPITEQVNLRFNMDAFNAFNIQGYENPGGGGVEEVQPGVGEASSYWSPRVIQLTMRLTF